MTEDTIGRERFCPRAESWVATWGPNERPADRCAECGELVIYNPTLGEPKPRLVCIDCLMLGYGLRQPEDA